MCSIVGCVGPHEHIATVLQGLRRLEYRGYDSAGCSGLGKDGIKTCKCVGGVDALTHAWSENPFDASTCIGHTRWATHGQATQENAHPHTDPANTVAVVHNGIIENEHELRQQMRAAGAIFSSTTDSELIAHLLASYLSIYSTPEEALRHTISRLSGAFAICAITTHAPGRLLVARHKSPICIGLQGACTTVASDVAGCAVAAERVVYVPERCCASVQYEDITLFDFSGNLVAWQSEAIDRTFLASDKAGHDHYMLKEIYEQKQVIRDTLDWAYDACTTVDEKVGVTSHEVAQWRSLTMAACGTSYFAGVVGSYYMQMIADLPSFAWIASEFRYRKHYFVDRDCFMVLSQSGETADTLEALRYVQEDHVPTLGMVNVPASSIEREADGCLYTKAKQEVCVASTKSFTAQISLLYWLAYYVGSVHGSYTDEDLTQAYRDMMWAAEHAEDCLERYREYLRSVFAPTYAPVSYMIFLGKQVMYPVAQEAALKVQELAYIPSYAYPAGELKHGPLALITSGVPVVLISSPEDRIYRKIIATAQEVRARGGTLIVFACDGQDELIALADVAFTFTVDQAVLAPIVMAPTIQALAYYTAHYLSRPIDKPRNLAKSVTVE